MSDPITDMGSIEPEIAARLKSVGSRTTTKLLEAARTPGRRRLLAERTGLDEKKILYWANMADKMRIKGVGEDYAGLLHAAGVDTVKELTYRNPANLARAMAEANGKRKLVRLLPSERSIMRWIEHARKLPLQIRY